MKPFIKIFFTLSLVSIIACGSSSTTTSTDDSSTSNNETASLSLAQTSLSNGVSMAASSFSSSSSSVSASTLDFTVVGPITCTIDGDFTYELDSATSTFSYSANECQIGYCTDTDITPFDTDLSGDGTDDCSTTVAQINTTDGSFSGTYTSTTGALTYDSFSSTTTLGSTTIASFTMDGGFSMAFDSSTDDVTITYDEFSGGNGSSTFSANGSVDYNLTTGLITGTITITNDSNTLSCTFDGNNLNTMTGAQWNSVCDYS